MSQKNIGLIIALVFASVLLSGSIVYFGFQLSSGNAEIKPESIQRGIENYVKEQQESQQKAVQKELDEKSAMAENVQKISSDDHIRGNKDAQISLIEFSDFECPYCKRFHPTAQAVVDAYDGKVNWVYRHFPLPFHDPLATKQAIATECAAEQGDGKFWEMTDLIYETTNSGGRGMDLAQLSELAEKIGLDRTSFDQCLESGRYDEHIQDDIADGSRSGVSGTPGTIIVNHKTGETVLVEGAQPLSTFQEVINRMLNE